jgi:hypothetical protein
VKLFLLEKENFGAKLNKKCAHFGSETTELKRAITSLLIRNR